MALQPDSSQGQPGSDGAHLAHGGAPTGPETAPGGPVRPAADPPEQQIDPRSEAVARAYAPSRWRTERLPLLDGIGPLLPGGPDKHPTVGRGWEKHPGLSLEELQRRGSATICWHLGADGCLYLAVDIDGRRALTFLQALGCDPLTADTWRIVRTGTQDRLKVVWRVTPEQKALLCGPAAEMRLRIGAKERGPADRGEELALYGRPGSQIVVLGDHHHNPKGPDGKPLKEPDGRLVWIHDDQYAWGIPRPPAEAQPLPERWFEVLRDLFTGEQPLAPEGQRKAARKAGQAAASAGAGTWIDSSPQHPCPICEREHTGKCSTSADGSYVCCAIGETCGPPEEAECPDGGIFTAPDGRRWKRIRESDDGARGPRVQFRLLGGGEGQENGHRGGPQGGGTGALEEILNPTGKLTTKDRVALVQEKAAELLADGTPSTDRLVLLRACAYDLGLRVTDTELQRYVWKARRAARGALEAVAPGEVMDLAEEAWLCRDLLLLGCLNLLVGLPKAGKTSLIVAMVAAWARGESSYLGLELVGPCPPVLLVGVDMPKADWGRMLKALGLMGPDNRFGAPIVGLFHKSRPLTLDMEGCERIAAYAAQYPGLLILLDSYAELTKGLGLAEKDADFAEPISDLMELVEPLGATVVLLHHSGKGQATESVSQASRGTTALPALSSQNINLMPAARGGEWHKDPRRVLAAEGRGGAPLRLLVRHTGSGWESLGSPAEVERAERLEAAEEKLNTRQGDVLQVVRDRWRRGDGRSTARQVQEVLQVKGADPRTSLWRNLCQLERKGLLQKITALTAQGDEEQFWPVRLEEGPVEGGPQEGPAGGPFLGSGASGEALARGWAERVSEVSEGGTGSGCELATAMSVLSEPEGDRSCAGEGSDTSDTPTARIRVQPAAPSPGQGSSPGSQGVGRGDRFGGGAQPVPSQPVPPADSRLDRQAQVLSLVRSRHAADCQPTAARDVVEALGLEGADAGRCARRSLAKIEGRGLLIGLEQTPRAWIPAPGAQMAHAAAPDTPPAPAAPGLGPSPDPPAEEIAWTGHDGALRVQATLPGLEATVEPPRGARKAPSPAKAKMDPLPPPPAPVAPVPRPYAGPALEGAHYLATAEALPDPAELPQWLALDLETFNRSTDPHRHVAGLFPSLGGEIRLAQVHDGAQTWVVDVALIGAPALAWLEAIARDPARVLVGHNLLFDWTFLIAAGIRPLAAPWDTMLAVQLLGDLASSSLAGAAAHYLGRELPKAEQRSDWGNELSASQLRYAALDTVAAWSLARVLHKELEATGQLHAHQLDCRLIAPAADGQVRGLAVDLEALGPVAAAAAEERDALALELQATLGISNWRSVQELHPALERALGVSLTQRKRGADGQDTQGPATDSKTLAPYRGVPVVDLLLRLRDLEQTLKEATWLQRDAAQADGRVRPSYRLLGANTGRCTTAALLGASSPLRTVPSDTAVFQSGERKGQPRPEKLPQLGFNFQGLTSRTKQALGTGDPETVLLDLDWSSIEVRLQGSPRLYGDAGCRAEILKGVDPHAALALVLFDLPKPADGIARKEHVTPEQRKAAKPGTFSLAYGCGPQSLRAALSAAQGAPVSMEKAQQVYDAWHAMHPQLSAQMDRAKGGKLTEVRTIAGRRIRNPGQAPNPDGTRRFFPLSRQTGVNFPVQGSGKDLLADAAGDLWQALDAFPGVRVLGLIHDEILLEVPRAQLEEVRAVALAVMTSKRLQETYLGDLPLEADAQAGDSWGAAH